MPAWNRAMIGVTVRWAVRCGMLCAAAALGVGVTACKAKPPQQAQQSQQVQPPQEGQQAQQAQQTEDARDTVGRVVIVNGEQLSEARITALEATLGRVIPGAYVRPGRYWYDRMTGGWGFEGGPMAGFILAGLNVGGPLRADASHGTAPIWVNGRQLHALDVAGLQALGVQPMPGRYWVDQYMNFGYEGGPMMGNIALLARQNGTRYGRQGSTNVWCDPGGACGSSNIRTGISATTDGQGGAMVSTGSGVVIVGHE